MPLRTRIIRALDEEIPISPREFTVEARQASMAIAKWRREHPDQLLPEAAVFSVLRRELQRVWGDEAVSGWEEAIRRVAQRVCREQD